MKFISNGGNYAINADHVRYFRADDKNRVWAVFGNLVDSHGQAVDREELYLCTCKDAAEVESFLTDLFAKIGD